MEPSDFQAPFRQGDLNPIEPIKERGCFALTHQAQRPLNNLHRLVKRRASWTRLDNSTDRMNIYESSQGPKDEVFTVSHVDRLCEYDERAENWKDSLDDPLLRKGDTMIVTHRLTFDGLATAAY